MSYNSARKIDGGAAMGEDFGSTYITIEDEEGNEFELEQLATCLLYTSRGAFVPGLT